MTITIEQVELELECGEILYADIEATLVSWPLPDHLVGLPEACSEGEDGEYTYTAKLSPSMHPFLASLNEPRIQAKIDEEAHKWISKNDSAIWKRFERKGME